VNVRCGWGDVGGKGEKEGGGVGKGEAAQIKKKTDT
jgi:hypothetical protein